MFLIEKCFFFQPRHLCFLGKYMIGFSNSDYLYNFLDVLCDMKLQKLVKILVFDAC